MKYLTRCFAFIILVLFLWSTHALYAEEIKIQASVDKKKVELTEPLELSLVFEGVNNVARPQLSDIPHFQVQGVGSATSMSIVNGRTSSSVTYTYRLLPEKTGTFTIGPFSFSYQNKTYKTDPIQVEVVESFDPGSSRQEGAAPSQEGISLKDRIFLVMELPKTTAYVNETIPMIIKLYVHQVTVTDIQYPELDVQGFSLSPFEKPTQYQETLGGINYDVVEFKTTLFPTRSGMVKIGPARLVCQIAYQERRRSRTNDPFSDSFFSGFFNTLHTEPLQVKSTDMNINVLDMPSENKPIHFNGAVGVFQLEVEAKQKEVKVGDPVTLRMVIRGKGNFATVTAPVLEDEQGFKLYTPQVTQQESEKIFEQILIPQHEQITQIPTLSFSYFDAETRQYKTLHNPPIPLIVKKAEKEDTFTVVEGAKTTLLPKESPQEELGRNILYIKESLGKISPCGQYWYQNIYLWVFDGIILIVVIIAFSIRSYIYRLKNDVKYAKKLLAPRQARQGLKKARALLRVKDTERFFDSIYATLREYLSGKFFLPQGGITIDVVDQVLKPKGVDQTVQEMIVTIFHNCDLARYASSQVDTKKMQDTLTLLEKSIDYLERFKE